jgi:hypothetical protein
MRDPNVHVSLLLLCEKEEKKTASISPIALLVMGERKKERKKNINIYKRERAYRVAVGGIGEDQE